MWIKIPSEVKYTGFYEGTGKEGEHTVIVPMTA
jgi:hypothetical protein